MPKGMSAGVCRKFFIPWLPPAAVSASAAVAAAAANQQGDDELEGVETAADSGSTSTISTESMPQLRRRARSRASRTAVADLELPSIATDGGTAAAVDEATAVAAAATAGLSLQAGSERKPPLVGVPEWATQCVPCPPGWYSPGGQIGFAECKPCPWGFGTGGVCASPNCLSKWHKSLHRLDPKLLFCQLFDESADLSAVSICFPHSAVLGRATTSLHMMRMLLSRHYLSVGLHAAAPGCLCSTP
jgi:hypothetical protein